MTAQDEEIIIRRAVPDDAQELLEIYRPYVLKTAITFEYDVPSLDEFRSRMERTLKRYPYLIAGTDTQILGYAYTGAFVGRQAYDRSAETTIYLKEDMKKRGLGRKLYQALENISAAQNITNLYACIGYPEKDDEYLTGNSAQFHEHLGYVLAGRFRKCGYKFGRWYDMIWMEKFIAGHGEARALKAFPELGEETLSDCGLKIIS